MLCIKNIQFLSEMSLLDLLNDLTTLYKEYLFSKEGVRGKDCEIFNCLVIRHTYCCIIIDLVIQSSILKSNSIGNNVYTQ